VFQPDLSNPRRSNTFKVDWNVSERSQAVGAVHR